MAWASLALFGLVYRAYPALTRSRLALAHFAASSTSAVAFPFGIYLALAHHSIGLALGASLLWLLGALLFLSNLVRIFMVASASRRERMVRGDALAPLGG